MTDDFARYPRSNQCAQPSAPRRSANSRMREYGDNSNRPVTSNHNLNQPLPPVGTWPNVVFPPGAGMHPLPNGFPPQNYPPPPPYGSMFGVHPPAPAPPPPPPNPVDQWAPYFGGGGGGGNNPATQQPSSMNRNTSTPGREYGYQNSAPNRNPNPRSPSITVNTNAPAFHPGSNYGSPRNSRSNQPIANGSAPRRRVQSLTHQGVRKLGSIPPIRDALGSFNDNSPIIVRFAQFCADSSRSVAPNRRRPIIHEFTGFARNARPRVEALIMLTKSDLDTLAWALGCPRGGRKIDVADRIGEAMRAPLQWRMPTARRDGPDPGQGSTQYAITNGSNNYVTQPPRLPATPTVGTNNTVTGIPPALNVNNTRMNMPAMPFPGGYGNTNPRNRTVPRKKGRDVNSIIESSNLMFPETPFNIPISRPLGNPHYVVFNASHLANGQHEPLIRFMTPNITDLECGIYKGKGLVEVHLRCLKVEISKPVAEWKQSWPFPAAARVNQNNVELDQAQRFTNGKLAGVDKATNITTFLKSYHRREKTGLNEVVIRRSANSCAAATGSFVMFVQPVLVRGSATMQDIVKENSSKYWHDYRTKQIAKGMNRNASDFEMGRRQVVATMAGGDDFAVSSQKVSLKCPLSLIPISIPVRGKDCSHIQCFDLGSYLDYTRRSRKFSCPVCNKQDASPSSLIISWFIDYALKKHAGCDEVEVFADGSIKAVANVRKGVASADSDSDEDDPPFSKQKSTGIKGAKSNGGGAPASSKSVEIVDLISDSDDEPRVDRRDKTSAEAERNAIESNQGWNGAGSRSTEQAELDMDEEFNFETTFNAEDEQVYPWDMPNDTTTEEDAPVTGSSGNNSGAPVRSSATDGGGGSGGGGAQAWNNGIEIICIDSD